MLKTLILLNVLMFCLLSLSAQEDSNIKLKIETGVLWTAKPANPSFPWFNGFFLHAEPKLKTSTSTFIGLRIGVSVNEQKNENFDFLQSYFYDNPNDGIIQFINPDNSSFSLVPTFEYCFIEKKNRPYLGVGVGYYFLTNYTDVSRRGIANPSDVKLEVSVNKQVGILLRGGFEVNRLIFGLEGNYIPKADIEISTGQIIGTVDNSYIGLSIGYALGLGKNSK